MRRLLLSAVTIGLLSGAGAETVAQSPTTPSVLVKEGYFTIQGGFPRAHSTSLQTASGS